MLTRTIPVQTSSTPACREEGNTVLEASAFARRATRICLMVPTGTRFQDYTYVAISRSAFLKEMAWRNGFDAMPSELVFADGDPKAVLYVGQWRRA